MKLNFTLALAGCDLLFTKIIKVIFGAMALDFVFGAINIRSYGKSPFRLLFGKLPNGKFPNNIRAVASRGDRHH